MTVFDLTKHRFLKSVFRTPEALFHHISSHLEICQKYSATRRFLDSPFCWKCSKLGLLSFIYLGTYSWKSIVLLLKILGGKYRNWLSLRYLKISL